MKEIDARRYCIYIYIYYIILSTTYLYHDIIKHITEHGSGVIMVFTDQTGNDFFHHEIMRTNYKNSLFYN